MTIQIINVYLQMKDYMLLFKFRKLQFLAKNKVDFHLKLEIPGFHQLQQYANNVTNNNRVCTVCSAGQSINIQGLHAPHNQYITEKRISIIIFYVWMSTFCSGCRQVRWVCTSKNSSMTGTAQSNYTEKDFTFRQFKRKK